jgi:hypothetical protein
MRDIGETREYFTAIKQPPRYFYIELAHFGKKQSTKSSFLRFFSEKTAFLNNVSIDGARKS